MPRNQGRTEILTLDNPQTFVVDIGADPPEVVVNWPAVPATSYGEFMDVSGDTNFVPNDNLILQSFMIVLPYCFNLSTTVPSFGLSWHETTGARFAVPEISSGGGIFVPTSNVEVPLNIDLRFAGGPALSTGVNAEIFVATGALRISMIGVPPILDGDELVIQLAIKILHNFTLVA